MERNACLVVLFMNSCNTFHRLQSNVLDSDSRQTQGVFQLAYLLYEGDLVTAPDKESLRAILVWFERHLIVPDKIEIHSSAIFWYKSNSIVLTQSTWKIAEILNKYGANIEFIRSGKPGYVIYEDDYQIAAIPFRDTFN